MLLVNARTATAPNPTLEPLLAVSSRARAGSALGVTKFPETLTTPVMAPVVAGVTVMCRMQLAPLASVVPQLSVSANSPLAAAAKAVIVCPV